MKRMRMLWASLVLGALAVGTPLARGANPQTAPDFPPGLFSDGHRYELGDFKGKLVVLFFYESACPKCRGTIPERNKIVTKYAKDPVKFLAIGAHDTLGAVRAYTGGTGLLMPAFADPFQVMARRYDFTISLQNIYRIEIIGPDGKVVGHSMETAEIDRLLSTVKWKYKDQGYNAKLNPAIELLEWNQYAPGVKMILPLRKSTDKALAESAEKLYQAVLAEGQKWKEDADKASDPIVAYDLYTKVSTTFMGDPLAKAADEALRKLKTDKDVVAELEARKLWAQLNVAMGNATPQAKAQVIGFCQNIATKCPNTPTGDKAKIYAQELENLDKKK